MVPGGKCLHQFQIEKSVDLGEDGRTGGGGKIFQAGELVHPAAALKETLPQIHLVRSEDVDGKNSALLDEVVSVTARRDGNHEEKWAQGYLGHPGGGHAVDPVPQPGGDHVNAMHQARKGDILHILIPRRSRWTTKNLTALTASPCIKRKATGHEFSTDD